MVTEDFNGKLDWDRLEGTMNVLVIPESLDQENLETARTLVSQYEYFSSERMGTCIFETRRASSTSAQLRTWIKSLQFSNEAQVLRFWRNRDAQIVYTSGTTGPPKGVVATHPQLLSQVGRRLHLKQNHDKHSLLARHELILHACVCPYQAAAVASEWFLNPGDTVLHHLPLHHTHGIVNALLAPLFAGAKIHMLPKFSPQDVSSVSPSSEKCILKIVHCSSRSDESLLEIVEFVYRFGSTCCRKTTRSMFSWESRRCTRSSSISPKSVSPAKYPSSEISCK